MSEETEINLEKGIIELSIYHNNEVIDFESIKEDFERVLKHLKEEECNIIEALRD